MTESHTAHGTTHSAAALAGRLEHAEAEARRLREQVEALSARLVEVETERHMRRLEVGGLLRRLEHAEQQRGAATRRAEAAEAHLHPDVAERLVALIQAGYALWDEVASHDDGGASDEALADARLAWFDAMVRYDTAVTAAQALGPREDALQ